MYCWACRLISRTTAAQTLKLFIAWPLLAFASQVASQTVAEPGSLETGQSNSVLVERIEGERKNAFNPYLLNAHRPNYVLPLSFTGDLNTGVYDALDGDGIQEYLKKHEVKFQLSVKVQLNERDLLLPSDGLFLGFTLKAWWQLYSKDVSSPFRETNYQPEIFYTTPIKWKPWGGNVALAFGLEHESNGQSQALSRSWNRLYAAALYERNNFFAVVRPWYRIPENEKETPDDSRGDDNPDIVDFMGHGEMMLGWHGARYEVTAKFRGNTRFNKGAIDLAVSFPLYKRFRGVVTYFNGYGESLIEYDHHQHRLGLGVLLSNLL